MCTVGLSGTQLLPQSGPESGPWLASSLVSLEEGATFSKVPVHLKLCSGLDMPTTQPWLHVVAGCRAAFPTTSA